MPSAPPPILLDGADWPASMTSRAPVSDAINHDVSGIESAAVAAATHQN